MVPELVGHEGERKRRASTVCGALSSVMQPVKLINEFYSEFCSSLSCRLNRYNVGTSECS